MIVIDERATFATSLPTQREQENNKRFTEGSLSVIGGPSIQNKNKGLEEPLTPFYLLGPSVTLRASVSLCWKRCGGLDREGEAHTEDDHQRKEEHFPPPLFALFMK